MISENDQATGSIGRREFLAVASAGGVLMALGAVSTVAADNPKIKSAGLFAPSVWYEIRTDGAINVNIAKAEMGQHIGTALARILADELGAKWSDIAITHVDTDPKWGYMITGSSWSVFKTFEQYSQAGAAGRLLLRERAADLLGTKVDHCSVNSSRVQCKGQTLSFAEIVTAGKIESRLNQEAIAKLPIKPASERRLIGKPVQALDIPKKTRGEAVYGIDVERPGMVYACPLIPPTRYGCSIAGIDDAKAKPLANYLQSLALDDPSNELQGWVAAIASDYATAMKAAQAIRIDWRPGPRGRIGEADILEAGERATKDLTTGVMVVNDGDVVAERDNATESVSATYRTHTVLHFTLEPQNAVVEFVDGRCHIHTGNQWQSLILPALAKALLIDESEIVIHQYFLGGGYGRRLWGDQIIAAALAAKALGKPVKMVFPRDEDSRIDCPRSPSVQHFVATFDADRRLTGLDHGASAGWPTKTLAPFLMVKGIDTDEQYDPFSISGADHWYTLPNHRVRAINNQLAHETFLPGWLRAVGPGWIAWGLESFLDELAAHVKEDPIAFRLARLDGAGKNAGSAPESVRGARRLAAVLEEVRERSGWGRELPPNEGMGVAVAQGQERVMPTWIACVAHVAVDPETQSIKVKKLWQSIDCGTVIHPDGALAQAEGATLWGLSIALHEGANFHNGHVKETNLDTYRPLRMNDVPEVDIRFMPSTEFPTGMGEPPLIPVPPAIGNAVFAATGKRVRDLPIRLATIPAAEI